jgi:hypothetical protein
LSKIFKSPEYEATLCEPHLQMSGQSLAAEMKRTGSRGAMSLCNCEVR